MIRTKAATYALLAIYEIARQHQGVAKPLGIRAADIARDYHLPRAYTAKILSQLAGAGILSSERGPHGGFRINGALTEITLFDVFDSVGAFTFATPETAPGLPPPIQKSIARAYDLGLDKLKQLYAQTTLADILRM